MTIEKSSTPKPRPASDHAYVFGKLTTDHILEVDWDEKSGWAKPAIKPYRPFQIDPANSTLHYALECFEGLKAYPSHDNKTMGLFRPGENMQRMRNSFAALAFPDFDAAELQKCITKLVQVDADWMPWRPKHSLYIRPTGISMEDSLGVRPASKVKLFCILSPVGPYYPKGFVPVSVYCYTDYVRAWYKGSGNKKIGSNYGPTINPARTVSKKGYDQILWLLQDHVTEVGVMNCFVYWYNTKGEKELITCPLDGTILPGVTRDSILQIARSWGEFKVTEERFTIHDLVKASKENRVSQSFLIFL